VKILRYTVTVENDGHVIYSIRLPFRWLADFVHKAIVRTTSR
jgi:hypothetical protein